MSKEEKGLPLKKLTNKNKESSLGTHGVSCPPWRIFLCEQEYTEEQLGIDFSNPLSKAVEKCTQTLNKGGELSDEKKTEAKSLSNYIPQSQKVRLI